MWHPFLQQHYPPSSVLRCHPTPPASFAFLPLLSVVRHTHITARKQRASRVAVHSQCQTCHGLRPRGGKPFLAINVTVHVDFRNCDGVVPPSFFFRGSIPSTIRLTACLLAVLRLIAGVTPVDPRTRYPVDSHPSGAGFTPA
jgi:hypothetical protein